MKTLRWQALIAGGVFGVLCLMRLSAQDQVPPAPPPPVTPPLAAEPDNAGQPPVGVAPGAAVATATPGTSNEVVRLEEQEPGAEATPRTGPQGQQLISVSLDNVPLEDVVRMFTRVSGANIIASATNLQGSVTVNLTDVEWRPALQSILDMHSLNLTEKIPGSGVYSIVPKSADAPEPMLVETLFIEYATVNGVAPVIKTMLVPNATISEFPSRNAIVVRSTSSNLGEIKQILKLIDIPGQQVCVETKFMELSDSASKQLGIRWDSLESFGVKGSLGPFSRTTKTESTDTSEDKSTSSSTKNQSDTVSYFYDVDGNQYEVVESIEAVEVGDTTESIKTITPTHEITDTESASEEVSSETVNSFSKTITEESSAILEMDSFNVVLSALKKTDGVSLISNPKLIVASGETGAFFSSGEREPIIRTERVVGTTESQGDKLISSLDTSINTDLIKQGYFEKGIMLKVIPTAKTAGLIEAEINPTIRSETSSSPKVVGDNSWPVIQVKEIKTRFTLRHGQTVAIGGLTQTTDSKATSKIPLLGDIPLLGKYLFSHTKDVKAQTETIIFVTLSLAQPDGLKNEEGIPEQAELVHKRLIQQQIKRRQFETDLSKMKQAAEAEEADRQRQEGQPVVTPPSSP